MTGGRAAFALLLVMAAGCSSAPEGDAQPPARTPSAMPSLPPQAPQPSPVRRSVAALPPAPSLLPLRGETGDATQVITVVAASSTSTTARLRAWDLIGGRWRPRGPEVRAYLGDQGITTQASESRSATPAGSFTLTQAFGRIADPGTRLPYFRTDGSDWWVTDVRSSHYNSHVRCSADCPFDTGLGENLYRAGYLYDYAVVIDYNRRPVTPGAGSAFFLHVTEYKPTTGCVSIPRADLVSIMRWLAPAAHPRIIMGVP